MNDIETIAELFRERLEFRFGDNYSLSVRHHRDEPIMVDLRMFNKGSDWCEGFMIFLDRYVRTNDMPPVTFEYANPEFPNNAIEWMSNRIQGKIDAQKEEDKKFRIQQLLKAKRKRLTGGPT